LRVQDQADGGLPVGASRPSQVGLQDVELVEGGPDAERQEGPPPHWWIARKVAPDRVISVIDPDARHAHKTVHRRRDGFKAHLAIEPETGLVTACALTKASGAGSSDATVGVDLLTEEPEHLEVLGDSAYGSGEARATLAEAGHVAVIKPIPLRPAVEAGFTLDDFEIDHVSRAVTCPAGVTRTMTATGNVVFGVSCNSCPLKARCTSAKDGRTLHVTEHKALRRAARRQAETPEFQELYRQQRPIVERSIAWHVRGDRKVRYRGISKNDQWLHHRTAGLNLRRLLNLGLQQHDGTWALA